MMEFSPPLQQGVLERRYKRFFADIMTPEGLITAHVPNTGSLKGCLQNNSLCLYATSNDPKRKLAHTLYAVQDRGTWVGVHTSLANHLVWEVFQSGLIAEWTSFRHGRKEVKIGAETRLDLGLGLDEASKPQRFIEVKSVTMRINNHAAFPDAVTSRGLKHLKTLTELVRQGFSAEIVFAIQRDDCQGFRVAEEIDPAYAEGLELAKKSGVQVRTMVFSIEPKGILFQSSALIP